MEEQKFAVKQLREDSLTRMNMCNNKNNSFHEENNRKGGEKVQDIKITREIHSDKTGQLKYDCFAIFAANKDLSGTFDRRPP